jgi:HK97 family phage portal protein
VAAMFGIPPSKLGIEDSNKYNTMVERNRAYADDALKPILNRITTVLTNFFYLADMTQEITFNSLDLLSLDPASMQAFATSAINNAFMTPNEARLLIGLEPIKGGDDLFANSALVPVELSKAKAKAELENLKKPVPPQQTVK